jgi:hypothetical protein
MKSTAELERARERAAEAKRKLDRLMPFKRWCAAVKPTDAAKEVYCFVRRLLKQQHANAVAQVRKFSRQHYRRT